jgi:hypothetical protein
LTVENLVGKWEACIILDDTEGIIMIYAFTADGIFTSMGIGNKADPPAQAAYRLEGRNLIIDAGGEFPVPVTSFDGNKMELAITDTFTAMFHKSTGDTGVAAVAGVWALDTDPSSIMTIEHGGGVVRSLPLMGTQEGYAAGAGGENGYMYLEYNSILGKYMSFVWTVTGSNLTMRNLADGNTITYTQTSKAAPPSSPSPQPSQDTQPPPQGNPSPNDHPSPPDASPWVDPSPQGVEETITGTFVSSDVALDDDWNFIDCIIIQSELTGAFFRIMVTEAQLDYFVYTVGYSNSVTVTVLHGGFDNDGMYYILKDIVG